MYCQNCGAPLNPASLRCPACGAVCTAPPPVYCGPQPKPPLTRRGLAAGVTSIVAGVLCFLASLYMWVTRGIMALFSAFLTVLVEPSEAWVPLLWLICCFTLLAAGILHTTVGIGYLRRRRLLHRPLSATVCCGIAVLSSAILLPLDDFVSRLPLAGSRMIPLVCCTLLLAVGIAVLCVMPKQSGSAQ